MYFTHIQEVYIIMKLRCQIQRPLYRFLGNEHIFKLVTTIHKDAKEATNSIGQQVAQYVKSTCWMEQPKFHSHMLSVLQMHILGYVHTFTSCR